jgi:DNA repair protein RecN (Recombination protein N)
MIEELRIRGLGVIDDAVLELAPGLTVVTGETGAGKTMVVTGLGLLFGGRADAGSVRSGTARAMVEGRVALAEDAPAHRLALELGGELEDGVLILARSVAAEGRSRAWVGGRAVPVGTLAELAEDLVAVHGQSDQHRLLAPARQREALDRFAGATVGEPLGRYRERYSRLRAVETELADLATGAAERARDADRLRFGLAEIDAAQPQPGEDFALDSEAKRLAYSDELRSAAELAHTALLGDPHDSEAGPGADVLTLVATARRALEQVRAHDAGLGALADRLVEVAALAADAGADLATYADAVDADPLRLAAVEERRAALKALTRKYGETVDEVLSWAADAQDQLDHLEGDGERGAELAAERLELRANLAGLADEVSAARFAAGAQFGSAVSAELADLAMPHAVVTVELAQSDDPAGLAVGGRTLAFGPDGVDDAELALAPHPGAPPRPLAKGASGGELSRVMLAVEVVFADADPVPTLVFDEVDAGVGGRAAVEVGRRLARLARSAQVLVVTHLPQVAAFADQHLVVEKSSDGAVTRSGVTALDGPGRVAELTRMLAGLEDSESGRAHAEELLAAAASAKSP